MTTRHWRMAQNFTQPPELMCAPTSSSSQEGSAAALQLRQSALFLTQQLRQSTFSLNHSQTLLSSTDGSLSRSSIIMHAAVLPPKCSGTNSQTCWATGCMMALYLWKHCTTNSVVCAWVKTLLGIIAATFNHCAYLCEPFCIEVLYCQLGWCKQSCLQLTWLMQPMHTTYGTFMAHWVICCKQLSRLTWLFTWSTCTLLWTKLVPVYASCLFATLHKWRIICISVKISKTCIEHSQMVIFCWQSLKNGDDDIHMASPSLLCHLATGVAATHASLNVANLLG